MVRHVLKFTSDPTDDLNLAGSTQVRVWFERLMKSSTFGLGRTTVL